MSEDSNLLIIDSLFKDLWKIILSLVIKRDDYATREETLESGRNADLYFMALNHTDTFELHSSYEEEVLREAGIPESLIPSCVRNRDNIPIDRRPAVLDVKRRYIINNFQELNNYYRKYLGLHKTDMSDAIKVRILDGGIYVEKYISDLSSSELSQLIGSGELNSIIANNPDKEYLNYLGNKKLDIFRLRRSKPCAIVYIDETMGSSFISNFKKIYEECRVYILNTVYDDAYKVDSEYYDGFIGMTILFMTIQRFIVDFIKIAILKDFYDQEVITYIFKTYGLPYFNEIPYIYQKRILKNLNYLLRYKGSDKVIIDILKIFGYEDITVFKYYLLKIRKFDSNNKPIFIYREEDGEQVEDVEKMYDLQFVQVPVDTNNMTNSISDTSNYIGYDELVTSDRYWGGDEDYSTLKRQILKSDFNIMETKYMSLNTIYNLTNYSFELCYFMKFLLDMKKYQINLKVPFSLVGKDMGLFNSIIFLFALVAKRLKYDGNIITSLSGVSSVYGFDLTNIDIVRDPNTNDIITLNRANIPYEKATDLMGDIRNNVDLLKNIMNSMANAKTRREYLKYKNIYDTLMITDINIDIYKMSNGQIATTYEEYLLYEESDLYEYLQSDNLDISEAIETMLYSFENYLETTDFNFIFTDIPNLSSDLIKQYIYLTIDIFKSYSIDLVSISSYYVFDDKFFNLIKVLDEPNFDTVNAISNIDNITCVDSANTNKSLKFYDNGGVYDTIEIVRT